MPKRRQPLSVRLRYRVTNPDAADYGREGRAVNVLDESDVQHHGDGPQRSVWLVIDFGDGSEPVAFHKDELTRIA